MARSPVSEGDEDGVLVKVPERDGVCDPEGDQLPDGVLDRLLVGDIDAVGDSLAVRLLVSVAVGEPEGLVVRDSEGELVSDGDSDAVSEVKRHEISNEHKTTIKSAHISKKERK